MTMNYTAGWLREYAGFPRSRQSAPPSRYWMLLQLLIAGDVTEVQQRPNLWRVVSH